MKTRIRLLACALAVAVPCPALVRAADASPSRTKGHVLLLENERTVEGDIELDGNQYRVRRQVGETWVPAGHVLCLCEDRAEAYHFLRQRANLRDPDERIRLGRWCQLHGLRTEALAEAKAAVELRPHSAEAQGLLQTLQKAVAAPVPAPAPPIQTVASKTPPSAPAVEVNAEAMGQFISRVQPVLMNACASCHVSGHAGSFQLMRALEGGMVNRHATQMNLQAVLAQVNREHWQESPLLAKAVTVHGQAGQPPLKNRQAPAFRNLEDWVRGTTARSPQRSEPAFPAVVAAPAAEPNRLPETVMAKAEALPGPVVSAARPATPPEETKIAPAAASVLPAPPATPVDPFDPLIFNRQMHPQRAK